MRFVGCVGLVDSLLGSLRGCLDRFPDKRRGMNTTYSMADIGMAAFSVFFMQSPSFLAHQRALSEGRGRSNAQTLFGMTQIACDNHIRQMLDGVPPEHFCPRNLSCPQCSTRKRSDGATEFFHSFVGATVVAPGRADAFHLPPE